MEYYVWILLPLVPVAIWILVIFIVSKIGWAALAARYKVDGSGEGTKIAFTTAWVNASGYRNAMILQYNDKGFYMQPIIPFRMFHPQVFIPWGEIQAVREKKVMLMVYQELLVGNPLVASIQLRKSVFAQLEPAYNRHRHG